MTIANDAINIPDIMMVLGTAKISFSYQRSFKVLSFPSDTATDSCTLDCSLGKESDPTCSSIVSDMTSCKIGVTLAEGNNGFSFCGSGLELSFFLRDLLNGVLHLQALKLSLG